MSFLVLDKVKKSYGRNTVLDDLSLEAGKGQTTVIFGPSGTGKTVLLRMVAGIDAPDAGDIRVDGRSVLGMGPDSREIGMAFQNFALYPHMTAYDNIASPLHRKGGDVDGPVRKIARLLRIEHVLTHLPRALSNGQKQRTALARALVRGPAVLLLDDPLRNVDAKMRYEMRLELPRVLTEFGSTVLYVTQDYKEAMALGDKVGVLLEGRFCQLDEPAAIYREPADVRVARLFGDPTINLYPVRPRRKGNGVECDLFGAAVDLPPSFADQVDRACLLGLRPEDIEVATEARDGNIEVELDAVTPLNVRTVLFLRTRDKNELLASTEEEAAEVFGRGHRQVWARIDTGKALLFDEQSGALLAAAA